MFPKYVLESFNELISTLHLYKHKNEKCKHVGLYRRHVPLHVEERL